MAAALYLGTFLDICGSVGLPKRSQRSFDSEAAPCLSLSVASATERFIGLHPRLGFISLLLQLPDESLSWLMVP